MLGPNESETRLSEVIEPGMMTRENRAKQFMPFDAMKGLNEALKDREERHSRVQKHGVSEEDQALISGTLCKVEKGSKVFISYFADFHDWEAEGIVTQINRDYRFLRMSRIGSQSEEKICFDDLYDIQVIG